MTVDLNDQEMQLITKFREMDVVSREQTFKHVMNSHVKGQSTADFLRGMDELRESLGPESIREITATLEEIWKTTGHTLSL